MSTSQPTVLDIKEKNAVTNPAQAYVSYSTIQDLTATTATIGSLIVNTAISLDPALTPPWPEVIADLTDVSPGPTNGQVHIYNSSNGLWEPGTLASGGGGDSIYLRTQTLAAGTTQRFFTSSSTPVYGGDGATVYSVDTGPGYDTIVINSAGVYRIDFGFEQAATDNSEVWMTVEAETKTAGTPITDESTHQLNNYTGIVGTRFSQSYIVNADSSYFPDGVRIVPSLNSTATIGQALLSASEANYVSITKLI